MRFWKQTLLSSFVIIAIIVTMVHSSCERNVCNNVTCFNGGSCSGGTCLCPLGWEDPQCQTLSRNRYIGTYIGSINCDESGMVSDTAVITADGVAINTVAIAVTSLKPKILHGYASNNQATYSIIVTNNDSLSKPGKTIYDKTYTVTLQNDASLSILSYTLIQDSTDSINSKCVFLATKLP